MQSVDDPSPKFVLQQLIIAAGIPTLPQCAAAAQIPLQRLRWIQEGLLSQVPVGDVIKLAEALGLSISEFLVAFDLEHSAIHEAPDDQTVLVSHLRQENEQLQAQLAQQARQLSQAADMQQTLKEQQAQQRELFSQEYERLQAQMATQRESLAQTFQQDSLKALESWLLQWPTVVAIAQQQPDFPAQKLIPLVQSVWQLAEDWGLRAFATVGETLLYDPTLHQLMAGDVDPGSPVQVRYVGYYWHDRLLYRAKVNPVENSVGSTHLVDGEDR